MAKEHEVVSRRLFLAGSALAASSAAAGCRPPAGARGDQSAAISATPVAEPAGAPLAAAGDSGASVVADAPAQAPTDASAISAETLGHAQKVVGVEYTDAERSQMVRAVEDVVEQARARRALSAPFELAPALSFDPRLPGQQYFGFSGKPDRVRLSRVPRADVPADDRDIAFASVAQLGDWLRRRLITSERLTEICLARLEEHGPRLECVVTLTRELALEQARAADRELRRGRVRGPLHGVPYGAKDLFDTRDLRTSFGAGPYKDRVATRDAAVVERLRAAGAVLVAKLSLGALAYGDIWFGGRTRNPWNPREGSSGSSAGSAAAVAAGLVPFALGTETYGSIVSPSYRCGATGLRPTFGRVSRAGAMPLCWSLDKVGPICRRVEDTVIVLAAIHGARAGDSTTEDPALINARLAYDARASVKGRRVGFDPAWFQDDEPAKSQAGKSIDRRALDALADAGLEPVELELPELPYSAMLPTLYAEAAAAFEDMTLNNRDDQLAWQGDGAWPNLFRAARFISAVDLLGADRLRRRVMAELGAVLASVDVVVSPSFEGPLLLATNFTGHPALTVRAGFEERAPKRFADEGAEATGASFRAPRAVTLYGKLFEEGALCEVGRVLEGALGVVGERPPSF